MCIRDSPSTSGVPRHPPAPALGGTGNCEGAASPQSQPPGVWGAPIPEVGAPKTGDTARVLTARGDGDPPDPVYLPADLEVLGVPEYYRLQRVDQDLPANTSLHTRTETYLLLRHDSATQPLVQATYPPFSTRQDVPTETPPGRDSSVPWAIRAVSLESAVSPAEPFARVLFHLQGPDWLPGEREHPRVREHPGEQEHPRERDLPCVTLHAHHHGRVARGTCRLQAPLGVCVVELEIPPRWFSPTSPTPRSRRRAAEPPGRPEPPEPVELHYSVVGPGECSRAGGRERSRGGEARRYLGTVELRASEPARRQEVRLDDKVLLRVPDATLRPGQRFTATVALRHNFTADQLTLRIKAKKGLQVVGARPGVPTAWSTQLERTRGPKHSTVVVTCRRSGDVHGGWRAADSATFLHLDLAVENGTGGLAPARPLTWQVEYPGQDPEAQKDKLVWEIQVSERDVRALVPLVQELEILNTAPLTGVPRVVPVKLVAVEAGGGVAELTEPPGCESADKQVLQVSDACDAVFVGGKESRGARGARVDFWARRLHASLRFTVWAPLLPLRVQLADTTLEQVRGWRLPGGPESSLDPAVATVGGSPSVPAARPWVVAEGPGRGALLQLSLHPPDACRRGRHRAAALATVTAWLEVGTGRRAPTSGSPPGGPPRASSPFPRAEGAMSGEAVTAASEPRRRDPAGVGPASTKLQGLGSSSEEEEEEGYGRNRAGGEEEEEEDEMVKAPERVTDLEIGMYVLLGVFCLAIFIFLINCIFFVLRYQQKELPDAGTAPSAPQPHNWVWLGTDQEELSRQLDRRQPEPPAPEVAPEAGRCCCGVPPGTAPGSETGVVPPSTPTPGAPLPRKEGVTPGGGRRKRVEFVTFASPRVPEEPPQPAPNVQSILVASEDDIRWVCEDMGLRDPEELRSYMERIRGSS
ncbi:transmembrane protein 132A [Athene cunicularia]|uniref:transmembrane protein 132A n=1 Tax=Athene cunicularia TaxID=194338 RepID=UPI000EF6DE0E|nr:transmembrane protein 132A [Athene cunicularia]